MADAKRAAPLPRHPAVWWSRLKVHWPMLVWAGAAVAAYWLYHSGGRIVAMRGVVEAVHEEIAPLETARLVACHVGIGQRVAAGTPVAALDTGLIDAEREARRWDIERQFAPAIQRIEAELREARERHLREASELRVLKAELERMEDLVRRRLLDALEIVRFRARREVLREAMERHPEEIAALEVLRADLREQEAGTVDAWARRIPATNSNPGVAAPNGAANGTAGWLDQRREHYTLRAQNDGVVAEVHACAGSVVQAGTAVVTLLVDSVPRVVAFLPEGDPQPIALDQVLHVASAAGGATVEGRVVAISPGIGGLPGRASPLPGRGVRGRQVLVELDRSEGFLPGMSVYLYAARPWWTRWRMSGRRRSVEAAP